MEIKKDKNFIVTKDKDARDILIKNNFLEMPSNIPDLFVFVNDPRKFTFAYEDLHIRFTNKLYF